VWRHVKKLQELGLVELEGAIDRGRTGGKIRSALWPNSTSLVSSFVCLFLSRMHVY